MKRMAKRKMVQEVLKIMKSKEYIRNIGIVAHIDHGKTTLTDSLLAGAGLLSPSLAGQVKALDYLEEEQRRGITIKTANISLLYGWKNDHYVVNLIDTPGHVDFSGKVTRALRAIDGVVVVVDAVEEIMVQTETVTRQALEERVKPILFINKVDRLIRELKLPPEKIREKFERIIRNFNTLIENFGEEAFKKGWRVNPENGSVIFGSALHKWGFTIPSINKSGLKFKDIMKCYKEGKIDQLQNLLPLHEAILSAIVKHLPNPIVAQKYRIPKIWHGNLESEVGQAMLNCDDKGPLTFCVTKIILDPHAKLVATGRIFSGTIKEGQEVYLLNARKFHRIQQVGMYMGAIREIVKEIPAGNIAAIIGPEELKSGETVVELGYETKMIPFEEIKYITEPVVTLTVEPKKPQYLQKMIELMKKLSIQDPNLSVSINEETGEYLLSGIGELHLEIAIKELEKSGLEIITSKPIVVYRETVKTKGGPVFVNSINDLNSVTLLVEPLEEDVLNILLEKHSIREEENNRITRLLAKKMKQYLKNANEIWAIEKHGNLLIYAGQEDEEILDVKNSVITGFKWACESGPLCGEPLRGLKVIIQELNIHKNPEMRDSSQIIPMIKNAIFKAILSDTPTILEPIYKIQIRTPPETVGNILSVLAQRRGNVLKVEQRGFDTLITAKIPVKESFGLATELRSKTSGRSFWQMQFSSWEEPPDNVAKQIIEEVKERKGIKTTNI